MYLAIAVYNLMNTEAVHKHFAANSMHAKWHRRRNRSLVGEACLHHIRMYIYVTIFIRTEVNG